MEKPDTGYLLLLVLTGSFVTMDERTVFGRTSSPALQAAAIADHHLVAFVQTG